MDLGEEGFALRDRGLPAIEPSGGQLDGLQGGGMVGRSENRQCIPAGAVFVGNGLVDDREAVGKRSSAKREDLGGIRAPAAAGLDVEIIVNVAIPGIHCAIRHIELGQAGGAFGIGEDVAGDVGAEGVGEVFAFGDVNVERRLGEAIGGAKGEVVEDLGGSAPGLER